LSVNGAREKKRERDQDIQREERIREIRTYRETREIRLRGREIQKEREEKTSEIARLGDSEKEREIMR
jgi:hypothetical protein